jgi:hypothetical protein
VVSPFVPGSSTVPLSTLIPGRTPPFFKTSTKGLPAQNNNIQKTKGKKKTIIKQEHRKKIKLF